MLLITIMVFALCEHSWYMPILAITFTYAPCSYPLGKWGWLIVILLPLVRPSEKPVYLLKYALDFCFNATRQTQLNPDQYFLKCCWDFLQYPFRF